MLPPQADLSLAGSSSHGRSAASWGAIIAGAVVAASASLILLAVGAGLGLASVSPFDGHGASATTVTVTAAIWLIVTQWVSACLGGYLAGRLRTRWIGTHVHEVFFRDTAHGLITWAVVSLIVAAGIASSASSTVRGAVHMASGAAAAGMPNDLAESYTIDKLLRDSGGTVSGSGITGPMGGSGTRGEVMRIVANAVHEGSLPDDDRAYLSGMVAQKTGISMTDAQTRVDALVKTSMQAAESLKESADSARSDAAQASLYTALSMLIGAFIASASAVLGGRLRDNHP